MAAVPAPARFQALREYLFDAQIDVDHLCFHLGRFLAEPDHLPRSDWFQDPGEEHQAWAYRETVSDFANMVSINPDAIEDDAKLIEIE